MSNSIKYLVHLCTGFFLLFLETKFQEQMFVFVKYLMTKKLTIYTIKIYEKSKQLHIVIVSGER